MTGRLPRETGVWSNARGADVEGPSHVRNIRDAGYRTAVIGKTHLWRTGPGPKPGLHAKEMDPVLAAWGFDDRVEVNDPIGTGTQGCAYTDFAAEHGFEAAHRNYIMQWRKELGTNQPKPWDQPPSPAPLFMDIDSFIGKEGCKWLQQYTDSKPFYLQVQFTGPHDPYDGPLRYRRLYDGTPIDVGSTELPANPSPILRRRLDPQSTIAQASYSERRQWRINYYANITLIDHWVGELLDTLDKVQATDNTWIVFSSDHGEMLGDLGLMGKTVFFEPSIQVPLLVCKPHAAGKRWDSLVQHVDLPVTLLDITGAEPLEDSLGQSLIPKTDSQAEDAGGASAYSELFGETTVITERFKLTTDAESLEPVQLLDRQEDPHELANFVSEPGYTNDIRQLTEQYLVPLKRRLNTSHMTRYREYVRRERRLN